jgi:hypothetical protein
MPELLELQGVLERIEARIAEMRKQELDIKARVADDHKHLAELAEGRAGLERLAAFTRNELSRPAVDGAGNEG